MGNKDRSVVNEENKYYHLNNESELFLLAINELMLFVNPTTFNVLWVLDNWESEDDVPGLTEGEIKDLALNEKDVIGLPKGKSFLFDDVLHRSLELLTMARIIRFDRNKYTLNKHKIIAINKAIELLTINSKRTVSNESNEAFKRIKEIIKTTKIFEN
jgi:hypothetical protein